MRMVGLADVLRDAGCKVVEDPGWRGRGKELSSVRGVVWHHTATGPNWQDGHVAALLRYGRRDLAGPLSQLGLERDGTFVVIADGRANHNGYGTWANNSIGIEAYNSGVGEPWPKAQLDAYVRGTAALLRALGYGVDRMRGHKETDPRRKIDPAGIDMNAARRRVAALMGAPVAAPTQSTSQPVAEVRPLPELYMEADMFLIVEETGIFAVIGEIFVGFPGLEAYAEAVKRSPDIPIMHLGKTEGSVMAGHLFVKLSKAIS